MTAYEMAERTVRLAGVNATPNKGRKSEAYQNSRQELIDCCGEKMAKELIAEAFSKL